MLAIVSALMPKTALVLRELALWAVSEPLETNNVTHQKLHAVDAPVDGKTYAVPSPLTDVVHVGARWETLKWLHLVRGVVLMEKANCAELN